MFALKAPAGRQRQVFAELTLDVSRLTDIALHVCDRDE